MSHFEQPRIKHLEMSLHHAARFCKIMNLYSKRLLPESIETWMLVQPLTSVLLAIYGSRLKVVWYLSLWFFHSWWSWKKTITIPQFWYVTVLRKSPEWFMEHLDAQCEDDEREAEEERAE